MASLSAPDPTLGVFETLLILAGEPIELDAHLDRLRADLATLFGTAPPGALREEMRERAREFELGRMRVTVAPGCTSAELKTEGVDPADFFPGPERGAALRSLRCDGGLGAHKWADRRRLGELPGGPVSLVLDCGDEALEAGRANVFVAHEGVLKTPPADGRILPGIARAGALAAAREAGIPVVEGPLSRDELPAADEVFLTGSVRGVEPVGSLDGAPLRPAGELSRRVGAGLQRRWLGERHADGAPAPAAARPPGQLVR